MPVPSVVLWILAAILVVGILVGFLVSLGGDDEGVRDRHAPR